MRREEALRRLPEVHRMVLVWLDEGEDEMTIATRLAIDPAAVPSLIAIANSKLQRLCNSIVP